MDFWQQEAGEKRGYCFSFGFYSMSGFAERISYPV
jgi:hypothetical protein